MTKFFKRFAVTALAVAAVFSMVACGDDKKEPETSIVSSSANSSASTEVTTAASTVATTEASTEFKLTSALPVLKKYTSGTEGGNLTMYYDKNGLVEKITNLNEVYDLKYEFDENNFPKKVKYPLLDNQFVDITFDITFDASVKKITAVRFIFDQNMKQQIDVGDEEADKVHMHITNIMDNYANYIGFQNAEFTNNINANKYTYKNGIDVYKAYNLSASSRTEAFKNEKGYLVKLNTMNEAVYKYDEMGKMTEMTVNGLVTPISYTKSTEDGYDVYTSNVTFSPAKYYFKDGYIARYVEGSVTDYLVDTEYNKYYQRTAVTNSFDDNTISAITFEYYQ